MRRLLIILAAICALAVRASGARDDDSTYQRLSKALETLNAVFREINTRYVDNVNPTELADVGVGAMLGYLDPYSEYYVDDETDEIESVTTGSYVGFGITVSNPDSVLTITDVREAGPARKAGIRIGDQLLAIDSVRTDTMQSGNLRPLTRGRAGSTSRLKILREGRSDTLAFDLQRSELDLASIGYSDMLPNNIGYISLERFTRKSGKELRQAIAALRSRSALKGLVVDLRDNPGGLLQAAIDVVETFVPVGSPVVSTRGRYDDSFVEYRSENQPVEPDVPLVLLINEGSASASEIVAGAMQDLDRAVVVGVRSFGKGLVQSIFPLGENAVLKLTTARYYTPSGRCIQRRNYRTDRDEQDTTTYRTARGRRVSATHGIDPDMTVSDSLFSPLVAELMASNLIQRFATRTAAGMTSIETGFMADGKLLDGFVRFVEQQPPRRRSRLLEGIAGVEELASQNKMPKSSISALEGARRLFERDQIQSIRRQQSDILRLLDVEVRTRFATARERDRFFVPLTPSVNCAIEILRTEQYRQLLTSQLPADH
ncbi:MAG: S41 family peptidase [Candidatus Kapabacteria bacterium]|nr:S41 family peptidase [Candidatus Kapabacteria bacterium]